MITILLAMLTGWILSFVGLDTLFLKVLGFGYHGYYLVFFVMGFFIWLKNISTR